VGVAIGTRNPLDARPIDRPPQLGLWAGVLPMGWWGELHNNDRMSH
jgi:hypothetical protein